MYSIVSHMSIVLTPFVITLIDIPPPKMSAYLKIKMARYDRQRHSHIELRYGNNVIVVRNEKPKYTEQTIKSIMENYNEKYGFAYMTYAFLWIKEFVFDILGIREDTPLLLRIVGMLSGMWLFLSLISSQVFKIFTNKNILLGYFSLTTLNTISIIAGAFVSIINLWRSRAKRSDFAKTIIFVLMFVYLLFYLVYPGNPVHNLLGLSKQSGDYPTLQHRDLMGFWNGKGLKPHTFASKEEYEETMEVYHGILDNLSKVPREQFGPQQRRLVNARRRGVFGHSIEYLSDGRVKALFGNLTDAVTQHSQPWSIIYIVYWMYGMSLYILQQRPSPGGEPMKPTDSDKVAFWLISVISLPFFINNVLPYMTKGGIRQIRRLIESSKNFFYRQQ
jgi:hypothetical protein